MSFNRLGFQGANPLAAPGSRVWTYQTLDSVATVAAAGYFNGAFRELSIGDLIHYTVVTGAIRTPVTIVARSSVYVLTITVPGVVTCGVVNPGLISTVTYSTSMTPDSALGTVFRITVTDGVAFTINAPLNPVAGEEITVVIRNASGGVAGAATWNAVFKMSTWTQPANATSRSITFFYDGTNWIQISQTGVDVPN